MLPDNRLSATLVSGVMSAPKSFRGRRDALTDYSRGGLALRDASLGLNYQNWTASCDPVTGEVSVYSEVNVTPIVQFTAANVKRIGLAFDQSMNPAMCYETTGESYLWWFNSLVNQQVFTEIQDAEYLCIVLDDVRQQTLATSDVILAYQKRSNGNLCYRQQRDRYETERVLSTDVSDYYLTKIGLGTNMRLLFEFYPREQL